MKFTIAFLLCLSVLLVLSCVQDSTPTVTPVRYTIIVSDTLDSVLDSAHVQLMTQNLDSFAVFTPTSGEAVFPEVSSDINQFSVSKSGYYSKDSVDYVPQPSDSVNASVVLRVIRFRLSKIPSTDTTTK